jgi:antirestriction protein ArdC
VQLPPFAAFRDAVAYYAVLAHEATHATSHPSRCGRDLKGRFGDAAHSMEEIAELGAAFLCADLALTPEPRPDHAAYVASWLGKCSLEAAYRPGPRYGTLPVLERE